jgi:hypothetical protein
VSFAPITIATSASLNSLVDVFEVVDHVVRHAGFGQQHVHVPGHAARDRVDRELHFDARIHEQLHELIKLVLRLATAEAVARRDDHLRRVAHVDGRIGRVRRASCCP